MVEKMKWKERSSSLKALLKAGEKMKITNREWVDNIQPIFIDEKKQEENASEPVNVIVIDGGGTTCVLT